MSNHGDDSWSWGAHTSPFTRIDGAEPAVFLLRQVDDSRFCVAEAFRYHHEGIDVVVGNAESFKTDLASIPGFMSWLVPINGRHTPAALVHDLLVSGTVAAPDSTADGSPGDPDPCFDEVAGGGTETVRVPSKCPDLAREDADDVFLAAMVATEVPILRRNLMFAAVVLATWWKSGLWGKAGILLWTVLAISGTAVLFSAIAQTEPLWILAALVAPLVGALIWGPRHYGQGVLAGYSAWFIAVPALATLAGYSAYWIGEQIVRLFVGRRDPDTTTPRPAAYR